MDIVEVLKVGLPGLVFLLSLLSYRLLAREQVKKPPNIDILKSIKHFMYVNIVLAIITVAAPIFDKYVIPNKTSNKYSVEARISNDNLDSGKAAVCNEAEYSGRYLLVTDESKTKMIQVYGMGILPCDDDLISMDVKDAMKIGLSVQGSSVTVGLAAAGPGQRYTIKTGGE